MGQHAEDIINGDVDEITGEWLGGGMGFPRTMQGERKNNSLSGVRNFLNKKGVGKSNQPDFMKEYLKSKNIDCNQMSKSAMAIEIQKDFSAFAKYTITIKQSTKK